jgi:HD superfamily phosphohydrolase
VQLRFQHALGVAYLAEKFIYKLMSHSAKLRRIITLRDIRCVKVAALCHDLGHGPFSHAFDEVFMRGASEGKQWTHEQMSVDMLEHLLEVSEDDSPFWYEAQGVAQGSRTLFLPLRLD